MSSVRCTTLSILGRAACTVAQPTRVATAAAEQTVFNFFLILAPKTQEAIHRPTSQHTKRDVWCQESERERRKLERPHLRGDINCVGPVAQIIGSDPPTAAVELVRKFER